MNKMRLLFAIGVFSSIVAAPAPMTLLADEARPQAEAEAPQAHVILIRARLTELGSGGKQKVLAEPALQVDEGKDAYFMVGGQEPILMEDDAGRVTIDYVDFGQTFRCKFKTLSENIVRIDASLENVRLQTSEQGKVRTGGQIVHTVESVRLGQTVRFEPIEDRRLGTKLLFEFQVERGAPVERVEPTKHADASSQPARGRVRVGLLPRRRF